MGINLTWVCHEHKRRHTSLRGYEGQDFQEMVRNSNGCPDMCLREGRITVYHDGYAPPETYDYKEMFAGGVGHGYKSEDVRIV
jgi:hypothetical protein